MKTKFCRKCGRECKDYENFCRSCGSNEFKIDDENTLLMGSDLTNATKEQFDKTAKATDDEQLDKTALLTENKKQYDMNILQRENQDEDTLVPKAENEPKKKKYLIFFPVMLMAVLLVVVLFIIKPWQKNNAIITETSKETTEEIENKSEEVNSDKNTSESSKETTQTTLDDNPSDQGKSESSKTNSDNSKDKSSEITSTSQSSASTTSNAKWSDWSDWSVDKVVPSNSKEVETRTVHIYNLYRYNLEYKISGNVNVSAVSYVYQTLIKEQGYSSEEANKIVKPLYDCIKGKENFQNAARALADYGFDLTYETISAKETKTLSFTKQNENDNYWMTTLNGETWYSSTGTEDGEEVQYRSRIKE